MLKFGAMPVAAIACAMGVAASPQPVIGAEVHQVDPSIRKCISQLEGSQTPVYLPRRLPHWKGKTFATGELGAFEYPAGYMATVSTDPQVCSANTLFYLAAGKGPVVRPRGAGKLRLATGNIAYYYGGGNFHTLDWSIGKYAYHIAIYAPQKELVSIANSMVPVGNTK